MQTDQSTPSPADIYKQTIDKQRIVICGTRGTASLAALVIHVLRYFKRPVDYAISSPVHGLTSTQEFADAPVVIIESKEAEILEYHHHIGVITNILWNASTGFASEEDYVKQFETFADHTPKGGILLYSENDPLAMLTGTKHRHDVLNLGYKIHPHTSENGKHFLVHGKNKIPVQVFGSQGFQNFSAARDLVRKLGITHDMFYQAIPFFLP
jgi:UDP-N-acetylmuramate: L-alanyl-gamma-D-glutamyl-meso-diaminopimelate ligase